MKSVGCRVRGVWCVVYDKECRVQRVGCTVYGVWCMMKSVGCRVHGVGFRVAGVGRNEFYMKRKLNQNLSGIEVYYTNSAILLVKNML